MTEFGQFLVGVVRGSGAAFQVSNSQRVAALQVGAGPDYAMTRTPAVRLQVDVRATLPDKESIEPGRQVRFVAGIVRSFR